MITVLKQNEYKCVELHESDGEPTFVTKRYSGQGTAQDIVNTRYIDQALAFFHQEFSGILSVPRPLSVDLEKCQVKMEFLPNLPDAKKLALGDLPLARKFFEHCYKIRDDNGFLRTAIDSRMCTPAVKNLLDSDFPVSLGFKGDLSENLCLGNGELILADIDSIALEPLGLSELLLYAQRFSSSYIYPALISAVRMPATPVAYSFLNRDQAYQLLEATMEVSQLTMLKLPSWVIATKRYASRHFLAKTISQFYLQ